MLVYRFLVWVLRLLLGLFYARIQVKGLENIPAHKPVVFCGSGTLWQAGGWGCAGFFSACVNVCVCVCLSLCCACASVCCVLAPPTAITRMESSTLWSSQPLAIGMCVCEYVGVRRQSALCTHTHLCVFVCAMPAVILF